jgi:hypothetical protein
MSKTTAWVIEEQQKKRHLSYMKLDPDLQKELDKFEKSCNEIEKSLDKFLENEIINPDDFNDDNADIEISLASDYGYQ